MIRVLITGCSMHSYDLIRALKDNYDGEEMILVEAMKNKWGKYYDYNYKRNFARIMVKR